MITARISGFKELDWLLRSRAKLVPKVVAQEAKETIADNSAEGVDIEGKQMKRYSKAHAAWRQKHGLPTSPVTLRITGSLIDKRRVQVSGDKSSLAVSGADQAKAEGIMQKRKFYPETEEDATRILVPRIVRAAEIAMSDREYI